MSIGPILNKTQLFINLKIYKRYMDYLTHRPDVYIFLSIEWLYLFQYRPDKPTKLENVVNFNLLFLTIWVSCRLSHKKSTRTQNLSNDDLVGGHEKNKSIPLLLEL